MSKKNIIACLISAAAVTAVSAAVIAFKQKALADFTISYLDMAYKIEREFIENIPVFRDYVTPAATAGLQKFDLKAHAAQVVKHGIAPLKNFDDINANIKNGKLVSISTGEGQLYYFHNVQKEFRYLSPAARDGLEAVTARFQKKLQDRKPGLPVVKLAVSSVIRTVDHQEKVFGRKFVSTHSYGGCFDIFFEDYYVQLPAASAEGGASEKIRKSLHSRLGFLMGDALREQFRTILMETLLELQDENLIYAFLENDRRCYHITILVK